ncbi:hypothetical protein CY35_03G118600 [Sphagnum magellanicum]|nr:hypothetical protein CY35_03G118600 [Sphagnum magellanicum]
MQRDGPSSKSVVVLSLFVTRSSLKDPANTTLLRMQKKLMSLHDTWQIYLATDTLLATVRRASMVQWKTAMDVYLGSSSNSHNPDYVIRGDYFEKNVNIYQGAQQAALVTRQLTFANIVRDRDNFGDTIFPGVDIVLIFALIVIMDEVSINENLELAAPWITGAV